MATRSAKIDQKADLIWAIADAGSGPSEIRRHILENDLLEAIIALPNDIFYNTGKTLNLRKCGRIIPML